jgi:hypothetical protein
MVSIFSEREAPLSESTNVSNDSSNVSDSFVFMIVLPQVGHQIIPNIAQMAKTMYLAERAWHRP